MDKEIWESLKQFCIENKDKIERIPWGSSMKGEGNLMYGLLGEDHPSYHWWKGLSKDDRDSYIKRIQSGVKNGWSNNSSRKLKHSETMKQKWADGKITADTARQNGNHGHLGKDVHNVIELEYKGKTYYGWRELQEGTGVTKHLYKKYYLNGIDPETRIGANGPVKGTT